MVDIYYVQSQARRISKCLYPFPYADKKICPEYLQWLDEDDFFTACDRVREIFSDYYSTAESTPALLNLPLNEIAKYPSTSSEAREGNAALIQMPAALFAIGMCAVLSRNALSVDIRSLKEAYSALRCRFLPQQLKILSDYGFVFEPFNGKALPKSGTIHASYPDNPDVLAVIAAAGDKLGKYKEAYQKKSNPGLGLHLLEQFIFLTPGIFADSTDTLPAKSFEHMTCAVGDGLRDTLSAIVDHFKTRGMILQLDTAFLKNRFFDHKGKDTLCYIEYSDYKSMWPDGNEQLYLRLKLNHVDAYIQEVNNLPPHLLKVFQDAWCSTCSETCNRRIVYHLGEEEKRACGCFFFAFKNPSLADLDKLMKLYDLEQEARVKK